MISEEVMISPTETRKLLEDGMSISRIKEMGNMILDVCNTKEVVLVVIFFDVSRRMYRIIGNICEAKGMKKVADDEKNHACFWHQAGSDKDVPSDKGAEEKNDA